MKESGIFSLEWWISVVIFGLVVGIVGGVLANRSDRKIDSLVNRLLEKRREKSEAAKAFYDAEVERLRASTAAQNEYLARMIYAATYAMFYLLLCMSLLFFSLIFYYLYPSFLMDSANLPETIKPFFTGISSLVEKFGFAATPQFQTVYRFLFVLVFLFSFALVFLTARWSIRRIGQVWWYLQVLVKINEPKEEALANSLEGEVQQIAINKEMQKPDSES